MPAWYGITVLVMSLLRVDSVDHWFHHLGDRAAWKRQRISGGR